MPGMALHHTGQRRARAVQQTLDVRIHHRIPIVERTRLSRLQAKGQPRIVHEDVRRAETLLCLGENVFDSRLVPHIQLEAVHAAGMRVLQLLQAFLAAGHRNDGPAFLNKTFGGGPADSRRSSGDIRDWHGKLL